MSGLRKAKKYDWKDSNMALFGSDTEKEVKKESAESEPAWAGAGQEVGLKIWRIVNFEVKDWDPAQYGQFFDGDSYIVLNTYQEEGEDALKFDVHFWIGKHSTQDEYCTVAYKTVELDTFLDDAAVQHREVQGHESALFRSYFTKKGIRIMEGGADTGFNHVEPEVYTPHLMHFKGKGGNVAVRQVPLSRKSLKEGDVYILDKGMRFLQYNTSGCNPFEKSKAMEFMCHLKEERGSSDDVVIDAGSSDSEFMEALNDDDVDEESDDEDGGDGDHVLLRLNTDEGKFEEVKTGGITQSDFVPDDVFLLDTPYEVFVWIGSAASSAEKRNGLPRAHAYMSSKEGSKTSVPLTIMREGLKSTTFQVAISA